MEAKVNVPNILIVDDEIGPRESLRMILKPSYNVYAAENGYTAIQMIQQTQMARYLGDRCTERNSGY